MKHPTSVMAWGGMSAVAVTKVHVISKGEMVNKEYYVRNILKEYLVPVLHWKCRAG